MKINFLKKEKSFKKKNFGFNPYLYWKIAVGGTLAIIIAGFFFGYSLFIQINQESPLPPSDTGTAIPTVEKDRITKVLNYFSEREIKSKEILNSPAPFVDPSL